MRFSFEVNHSILNVTTEICMRRSAVQAPTVQAAPPASDHPVNSMVSGCGGRSRWSDSWGSVSEEAGIDAEPHLLSGSVLSAGGAHHPPLS